MKTIVIAMCLMALAGWAGDTGLVGDSTPESIASLASAVARSETLAVADSGYLFIYGNEISRPFVFTVERDTVRINGIPYRPRLRYRKPRVGMGWAPPALSSEQENLIRNAKVLGERLLTAGEPYTGVVDSVAASFRRNRLVEGARNGAIAVTVEFRGVDGVYILGVPVKPPPRVREWEEIWVETPDDVPTKYALILMEPYHVLLDEANDLDLGLHEQGIGYEERMKVMGDMLSRSELVERVDVKPASQGIDIYYHGIQGAYTMGVGRDPTERPFYLTNPKESRTRALELHKEHALRLADCLSGGAFIVVGPGDLVVGRPNRLLYLEAARRISRGEGTQEDLYLLREAIAQRLMDPVPLERLKEDE